MGCLPMGDERTMALAVLQQAIRDAALPLGTAKGSKHDGTTTVATVAEIIQAREFWTAETGEWAQSRKTWCDMAGVDPDYAQQRALRSIAVTLGGCITRHMEHRQHYARKQQRGDARREMARDAYARWKAGTTRQQLQQAFGMDQREVKALLTLGKLHATKAAE